MGRDSEAARLVGRFRVLFRLASVPGLASPARQLRGGPIPLLVPETRIPLLCPAAFRPRLSEPDREEMSFPARARSDNPENEHLLNPPRNLVARLNHTPPQLRHAATCARSHAPIFGLRDRPPPQPSGGQAP